MSLSGQMISKLGHKRALNPMPTLTISGPALAVAKNPRATKPITDRKTLIRFHGLVSEEACADVFEDPRLNKLKLSGEHLRFVFDDKTSTLRIITAYRVPRPLTEAEIQLIVDATKEQWSDGCGSGSFDNFHGTVLSTTLAMALLNSGHPKDEIGDFFVDAFPPAGDEEFRVEFLKEDAEKTDLDFLQEAATWGEPQAQFQLARQLEEGEGVKKNGSSRFRVGNISPNECLTPLFSRAKPSFLPWKFLS